MPISEASVACSAPSVRVRAIVSSARSCKERWRGGKGASQGEGPGPGPKLMELQAEQVMEPKWAHVRHLSAAL